MKKIVLCVTTFFIICVLAFLLSEFEIPEDIETEEDRTLNGVIYDKAYYREAADGLRSRAYTYYLFSDKEKKVIEYKYLTAGNGMHHLFEGTFEGSLDNDDGIVITMEGFEPQKAKIDENSEHLYIQKRTGDKKK